MLARLFRWSLLACVGGCGGPEQTRSAPAAVAGTTDDAARFSSVVGVVTRKGEFVSRCTGALVAPKLMLTARHCVAFDDGNLVECGQSPLGASVAPQDVLVTALPTQSDEPTDYVAATEIIVAPGGDDTCGFDFAAVRLADGPPGAMAMHAPRLDSGVVAGESFTAVGYGTNGATGLGTRRYLEGALVACSGSNCPLPEVQSNEWLAEDDAFCRADSGAAALDAEGRLIGTVSRGQGSCETPILAAMPPWKDWLLDLARQASSAAGDEPPAWAMDPAEPPEDPVPQQPSNHTKPGLESTCSLSLPRADSGALFWLLACLVGLGARRRSGGVS